MKISAILDLNLKCAESPVWLPHQRRLVVTDCSDKKVLQINLGAQPSAATLCDEWQAACVCEHVDGGLVLAGPEGLRYLDKGVHPIEVQGHGHAGPALNDVYVDARGRMIGGAEHFREEHDYAPGSLWSLASEEGRTATATALDRGYHLANGVATSPDGRVLYATDSVRRSIFAYQYDAETGRVQHRRTLHAFGIDAGVPDGLAVDEDGFLWCAMFWGGCVLRLDPAGCIVERVALPASQVTSLCFGGDDLCDVFITTAAERVASRLAPISASAQPTGGALFHLRSPVRGLAPHLCRIYVNRPSQRNVK
ncbi:MAG: SMP-30/gluconolactonase/LRE family protein [Deltaproteobacteria bacterium]|nr:SMP-30/gluconolactonase/LRE family protein [Deltaproteobacteria bacterium]